MEKVNLGEKLALFADHWSPKVVARTGSTGGKIRHTEVRGTTVLSPSAHD